MLVASLVVVALCALASVAVAGVVLHRSLSGPRGGAGGAGRPAALADAVPPSPPPAWCDPAFEAVVAGDRVELEASLAAAWEEEMVVVRGRTAAYLRTASERRIRVCGVQWFDGAGPELRIALADGTVLVVAGPDPAVASHMVTVSGLGPVHLLNAGLGTSGFQLAFAVAAGRILVVDSPLVTVD